MFEESRDFLFVISLYVWDAAVPFTGSSFLKISLSLNAAPHGWCKQGMFPLLLRCSLQSPCGLPAVRHRGTHSEPKHASGLA